VTTVLWQLERDSAENYAGFLVPRLLEPAARRVVERAHLAAGDSVLDVGCGSGAAAATAAAQVAPSGRVVAADVNRHLLALGRAASPQVEFWEADARALPFPDRRFDAVLCAQVLQFVPEPALAAAELHRILRPGGRAVVSTWAGPDRIPYLGALAAAVGRRLGPAAAEPLHLAMSLADPSELAALLTGGGLRAVEVTAEEVTVPVDDLSTFVPGHLAATPIAPTAARAPAAVMRDMVDEVADALGAGDGRAVDLTFVQLVATATG
jgi:SAM-dependent methyltransferase